jgi:hypothetical protein
MGQLTFPEDLPWMIEYRVGSTVRITLPRVPVHYVSSSGSTDAAIVCPRIPLGCTGWRRAGELAWRSLKDVPRAWMPFLDRERGTEMDPRPKPKAGSNGHATDQ